MINYRVETKYSKEIGSIVRELKKGNIHYNVTHDYGFIYFEFYDLTDAERFETLCFKISIQFQKKQ